MEALNAGGCEGWRIYRANYWLLHGVFLVLAPLPSNRLGPIGPRRALLHVFEKGAQVIYAHR